MWILRHCWNKTLLTPTRNATDVLCIKTQKKLECNSYTEMKTFQSSSMKCFILATVLLSTNFSLHKTTLTAREMDDSDDNTMIIITNNTITVVIT